MSTTKVPRNSMVMTVGVAALCVASSCSYLFVQPLPADAVDRGRVTCTTNVAPPVLDTIFTITNLLSVIYVASQNNNPQQGARIGLGLSVATLWAISAGYGYNRTSECKAWLEEGYDPPPTRQPARPARVYVPPPAGFTPPSPGSVPDETTAAAPPPYPAPVVPAAPVAPAAPAAPPVPQQLDPDDPSGKPPLPARPAWRH